MDSKEKPFIHLFETAGGKYLYDVNKNSILKISENLYDKLMDKNFEIMEAEELKKNGFLSSKKASMIIHPEDDVLEEHLDNKINMLTLQITQACNLRCRYCPYSGSYNNRHHTKKKMSLETAKKGIDFLLEHSIDCEQVSLGFYGGEPLLEFGLIKSCVEYAKSRFQGKNIKFTLTTNGTILSDEIIKYFESNDISIMISLDGPRDIHNKNRKFTNDLGSFDVVLRNIRNIKENFPGYFPKILFNVVVDPENDFNCTSQFLSGDEIISDSMINPSNLNEFYRNEDLEISEDFIVKRDYEIFKLFLSGFGRLSRKQVSPLVYSHLPFLTKLYKNQLVMTNSLPDRIHHSGPCIPGAQRLFMNADGIFYPCERVSEESRVVAIGNINSGIELNKVRNLLNVGKLTEEHCKNCWAIRYCSLCLVACDNLDELSSGKKLSYCTRVRASVESNFKDICTLRDLGMELA